MKKNKWDAHTHHAVENEMEFFKRIFRRKRTYVVSYKGAIEGGVCKEGCTMIDVYKTDKLALYNALMELAKKETGADSVTLIAISRI